MEAGARRARPPPGGWWSALSARALLALRVGGVRPRPGPRPPRPRPAPVDGTWLRGGGCLQPDSPAVPAVWVDPAGAAGARRTKWRSPPPHASAVAVAGRAQDARLHQSQRVPAVPVRAWFGERERLRALRAGGAAERVRAVLIDYSCTTTLHGIGFVGNESAGLVERCMWAVAVLLSAAGMCFMCWARAREYSQAPTVMKIEQNDLPTFTFPFPAVTICPTVRIKIPVLSSILVEYADRWGSRAGRAAPGPAGRPSGESVRLMLSSNGTHWHPYLMGIAHTLFHYQYPKFRLMQMGLSVLGDMLPLFDGLPISQIMMRARPTCNEVLERCYWRGAAFSCCDQFQLQRTEMGYCMSFNSRTATGPKILCSEKSCHHVWSTGPGTGLVLIFRENIIIKKKPGKVKPKRLNPIADLLGARTAPTARMGPKPGNDPFSVWDSELVFLTFNSWTEKDHVLVMVHDRWSFPMVTRAFSFSTLHKNDYSLAVSYSGTKASPGLERIRFKARQCVLPGERRLETARRYTQRDCLAQCRLLHASRECGCRPYYSESFEVASDRNRNRGTIPECRFSQLPCLSGLNLVAINCSHCVPLCAYNEYAVRVLPSVNVKARDAYIGMTLDISYDMFRTAVLYRKQLAVNDFDMLVITGGLASLCLGCSILSSLDIFQVLRRVIQAAFGYNLKLFYHRKHNPQHHLGSTLY